MLGLSFHFVTLFISIGKILNDASPLSEYKILESNFVVVMVSKSKPAKTTAPSSEVCYVQYHLYMCMCMYVYTHAWIHGLSIFETII